jgi:outer membrane protein assembly factor BamB
MPMIPALILSLVLPSSRQADWPHFLGPTRDNVVVEAGFRLDWDAKAPEIAWRRSIGPGFGGVAVHGDEVFLLDRDPGEGDLLRVFDLTDGEERWIAGYAAPGRLQFPGSRTVCAVDGDHVYSVGGFGQVACFDRRTQELAWDVDMSEVYGGELPMFGWSGSPLLWEDLLIGTSQRPVRSAAGISV